MPLIRRNLNNPKPPRQPYKVVAILGEFGRYFVPSASAPDEGYNVDVLEEEHTKSHGLVKGTCPCKGWSVRKTCTHLDDAKAEHERRQLFERKSLDDLG